MSASPSDQGKQFFRILDGVEAYGDGTRSEQARRFRLDHLMEADVARLRESLASRRGLPQVDLLISLAGFSPETTIIAAMVFRPKRVLVISSDQAYENIDVIGDYLLEHLLRSFPLTDLEKHPRGIGRGREIVDVDDRLDQEKLGPKPAQEYLDAGPIARRERGLAEQGVL